MECYWPGLQGCHVLNPCETYHGTCWITTTVTLLALSASRSADPDGNNVLNRFEVPQHNPEDEMTWVQHTKEIKEGIFEDYYEYKVAPVNFGHPFRYSYLDVENNHRLTTWATGLSLEISSELALILFDDS